MTDIFKRHPELEEVFQTSDGTLFYEEGDARNHARSLKDKAVERVKRGFQEAKPKEEAGVKKLNALEAAKLRIEAINELNTVEDVEAALAEETAKTVLKAGADRIAAILASEALNSEDHPNVNETE